MSGSRVYEFHQREIDDLKTAAVYALAVCTNLKRLLEGIRDNQPHWASRAIREFLDPNNKCESYLDKVDHLIDPVGVPVNVPRRAKVHRGSDGIHYEKKFPLTCEMREEPLAHRAAWVLHNTFSTYLWSVWRRGNPTYICSDDVGAAADELVGSRWQEIRDELEAFVDYDCDGLRQAVEAESKAAMERCRQSIVGDAATTLKPDIDAGDDAPKPSWDRTKGELTARFDRVLSALRAVIATETALDPAWEETKKGVGGAFADALFSRSQARTVFEDETPTMDALVINLRDNRYKAPSWPSDGADDAQTLRSVWHAFHDRMGAGKPFTADDLSVMRNLYVALERAREKLTSRDASGGGTRVDSGVSVGSLAKAGIREHTKPAHKQQTTAAEHGKETLDEQDSADSEHSAGDGMQDSTRKERQIRLANWAIAVENGKTFRLFHRRGQKADWRESGKVDIPAGLQRSALLVLAEQEGALTKDEAIKAFQAMRKGKSDREIMKSVVTPTLTKLRSIIKAAIARVPKVTVEPSEIGDPLPYDESSNAWRSEIVVGFAEKDDMGERLRFVTKSQQTAELEAANQGYFK